MYVQIKRKHELDRIIQVSIGFDRDFGDDIGSGIGKYMHACFLDWYIKHVKKLSEIKQSSLALSYRLFVATSRMLLPMLMLILYD